MTLSVATAINFVGNVMDNLQQDPQAAQHPELHPGIALDALKNTPVEMFSNIPLYNTEADNNESSAVPEPSTGP